MNALTQAEGSVLLWIQDSLRSDFLTPIMKVVTLLGDKGILWILVALALLCVRRTRPLGARCVGAMVIGLLITNLVIKNWVARTRPYDEIQGLLCLVAKQDDFSFPSGHATNSLACAWVLFRRTPRKYGVPALVVAILICLSRLYVGIHYPTDVLGGVAIGICAACLSLWLSPIIEKKIPLVKKFYKL